MATQKNNLTLGFSVPFTQVSNFLIQRNDVSFKAKCVYNYMLSRASIKGWKFYRHDIVSHCQEGKSAVDAGIKELKEKGYLSITPNKLESGRIEGHNWVLLDPEIGFQIPEIDAQGADNLAPEPHRIPISGNTVIREESNIEFNKKESLKKNK